MNIKSTTSELGISKYSRRAKRIAKNPNRLKRLLEDSQEKINTVTSDSEKVKGILGILRTLVRMMKAYLRGEYKVVPWKTLLLIVGALIYFVSPLDFIPDFIPITGFIDDFSIVVWVFSRINKEIKRFEEWESGNVEFRTSDSET